MAQESVEGRVREVLARWTVIFHGEDVLGTNALVNQLVELIDAISDEAYARGQSQVRSAIQAEMRAGRVKVDAWADIQERRAAALDADY